MTKDETGTVERVRRRYEAPLAIRGPYTHEEIGVLLRALDEAREEAEQWHRKAQETDDVRLRAALLEREHMQRERDEARAYAQQLRDRIARGNEFGQRLADTGVGVFERLVRSLEADTAKRARDVMEAATRAGVQPSLVVATNDDGVCFYFFPSGHALGDMGRAHAAIECMSDGTAVLLTDRTSGYARAWDLEPPHTLDAALVAIRQFLAERDDEARAELGHMRQGYDRLRADRDYHCDRAIAAIARAERAEAALAKVNAIRNSIVGAQTVNWSEHVYPLVAALDAAGLEGLGYEEARRSVGTLLERAERAEARLAALRSVILPCSICRGRGVYWTSCSMCGDSTFEHDCDSKEVPCPAPACGDLRRALADTEAAAEAYTRRVRAEALRKVREAVVALEAERRQDAATADLSRVFLQAKGSADTLTAVAEMLATMADEIERGAR